MTPTMVKKIDEYVREPEVFNTSPFSLKKKQLFDDFKALGFEPELNKGSLAALKFYENVFIFQKEKVLVMIGRNPVSVTNDNPFETRQGTFRDAVEVNAQSIGYRLEEVDPNILLLRGGNKERYDLVLKYTITKDEETKAKIDEMAEAFNKLRAERR